MALALRESMALWPTAVATFTTDDPALCADAREEILARAAVLPTVPRGERTGWQSASDLLAWTPRMREVGALFAGAVAAIAPAAAARGVGAGAWANVLCAGDHVTPHTHAEAVWSAVWYVDAGDSDEAHGGLLALRDPRAGAGAIGAPLAPGEHAAVVTVAPRTGLLVVFPAWLVHWVTPYRGARPRISVAANLR